MLKRISCFFLHGIFFYFGGVGCSSPMFMLYPIEYYSDYTLFTRVGDELIGELEIVIGELPEGTPRVYPSILIWGDLIVRNEHMEMARSGEQYDHRRYTDEEMDYFAANYSLSYSRFQGDCVVQIESGTDSWLFEQKHLELELLRYSGSALCRDSGNQVIRKTYGREPANLLFRNITPPVFFNRGHKYRIKITLKIDDKSRLPEGFLVRTTDYSNPFILCRGKGEESFLFSSRQE